jgi:WD40 repeat protein
MPLCACGTSTRLSASTLGSGTTIGSSHSKWIREMVSCSQAALITPSKYVPYIFIFANSTIMHDVITRETNFALQIWSTQTNRCTATLNGHSDQVRALAVSGNQLFTGSYDCTIKVSHATCKNETRSNCV